MPFACRSSARLVSIPAPARRKERSSFNLADHKHGAFILGPPAVAIAA